jgi:hypothetical protein
VQIAVQRTVTDAAQQQHAAVRQPVVAQEHATERTREAARAREQRPEALERRGGGRVRDELVLSVEEREARDPRRGQAGQRREDDPPRPPSPPEDETIYGPPGAPPRPDGKGSRVDIKL